LYQTNITQNFIPYNQAFDRKCFDDYQIERKSTKMNEIKTIYRIKINIMRDIERKINLRENE